MFINVYGYQHYLASLRRRSILRIMLQYVYFISVRQTFTRSHFVHGGLLPLEKDMILQYIYVFVFAMIIFFLAGAIPQLYFAQLFFFGFVLFFKILFGGKCLHTLQQLHITTKRIRRVHGDTRITIHDNLNLIQKDIRGCKTRRQEKIYTVS